MSTVGARIDRARGVLVGAVLGDAFGAPFEGASPEGAARIAARRAASPQRWGYTDDGAMCIAVAEALRDAGTVAPTSMLDALARRYEPARGFGKGMKLAVRAHESGVRWQDVARQAWPDGSRGNGGAVRAGVVAIKRWTSAADLDAAVRFATRLTHAHAEAIEGARLLAHAVALLLERPALGDNPPEFLAALDPVVGPTALLERLRAVATNTSDIADAFGTSPLAVESVPAALAVFLRHGTDAAHAFVCAASLGGDIDSICSMVGSLVGARHGLTGLPAAWIGALGRELPTPAQLVLLADEVGAQPPARFVEQSEHA